MEPEIKAYYANGVERDRLRANGPSLELVRTQELLERFLPPAPARVLDVGGATGVYAAWLAEKGYAVRLLDPVGFHVEQALEAAARQPEHSFEAAIGDARHLEESDSSYDAVLLLGPLYHLTSRDERILALREAQRVLRPGAPVAAAAISRFASLLSGLADGFLSEPEFRQIVERDLRDGQHRNPLRRAGWFTTAYFHHPDELREEIEDAGLEIEALLGIQGPGGLFPQRWGDPDFHETVVWAARALEAEPAMLGVSFHLLAVARKTVT